MKAICSFILLVIITVGESWNFRWLDVNEYQHSIDCGQGWKDSPYGNSYKMFPPSIKRNWTQAQAWCQSCGAELPWPQSKNEMFWLHGWVSSVGFPGSYQVNGDLRYWLSGYYSGKRPELEFRWKTAGDAPDVKVTYNMWKYGDPNNYVSEDTCIHYWGNGGYWAETRCRQRYGIICQKEGFHENSGFSATGSDTEPDMIKAPPSPIAACAKTNGVCAGFCMAFHERCGVIMDGSCWCESEIGERLLANFNP